MVAAWSKDRFCGIWKASSVSNEREEPDFGGLYLGDKLSGRDGVLLVAGAAAVTNATLEQTAIGKQ